MKARILLILMLPVLLSGCAVGLHGRLGNPPSVQSANIQVSPASKPDEVTTDGARIWKDDKGRVEYLKVFSGPVFRFHYDKFGQIDKVIEPSGAVLKRKAGREWQRTNPDGTTTGVYGIVMVGNSFDVRYLYDDGSQTIYNGNGYVVETESVDGNTLIKRVTDTKGRASDIRYDADGKPYSIKTFDGALLTESDDGKWYRTLPGSTRETVVPYTVVRDPDSGYVILRTPSVIVIYQDDGVREEHIKGESDPEKE
jgi:hypothetical protein